MQASSRPFESLDWYRDASRRQYRRRGPFGQALAWLKSARAFAFHIGLFALGCTIALAWNVARDPDDIWVDRLALAWLIVLVIHAAIAVLVFTIGLLGGSEPEFPAYQPRSAAYPQTAPASPMSAPQPEASRPQARPSPDSSWGPPPPAMPEQPGGETARAGSTSPAPPATRGWANWSQQSRSTSWGVPRSKNNETASWSETSPGAMIRRRRMGSSTGRSAPASAPTTTGDPGSDA